MKKRVFIFILLSLLLCSFHLEAGGSRTLYHAMSAVSYTAIGVGIGLTGYYWGFSGSYGALYFIYRRGYYSSKRNDKLFWIGLGCFAGGVLLLPLAMAFDSSWADADSTVKPVLMAHDKGAEMGLSVRF